MRRKNIFVICPILLIGFSIVFFSSCQKDKNIDEIIPTPTPIPTPILKNITDPRDSNVYQTVIIGNQEWMAENLKYLPSVNQLADGSEDANGSYYYVSGYNDTDVDAAKATNNYATYGVLYNWTAAMADSGSSTTNPSGVQGVCPSGWHLPSDREWTQLTDYLGGIGEAGNKLKEIGTTHWESPNTDATNETGFTALPAGSRGFYVEESDGIGFNASWWSATDGSEEGAWSRCLSYYDCFVFRRCYSKYVGFSVRCVKD